MSKTYPIALVVAGRAVLVVGGGEVAARKVKGLIECEARLTVVAPQIIPELAELCESGVCSWVEKSYEASDLEGIELVFAATNDEDVNVRVSRDAAEQKLFVNVADRPELCTFYLPSVLRRGSLSIAVSTDGSSPLTARLIRESLEGRVDAEMGVFLELLQSWRPQILATLPEDRRRLFWERAHDGQAYEAIKQGSLDEAQAALTRHYEELLR